MALSLNPKYLGRYKDILLLLFRYGREDLDSKELQPIMEQIKADEEGREQVSDDKKKAEQFASDLEHLGPTFIKLGQLLSTRPDLLPESYRVALTRLQDHVEEVDYETIEKIVEKELGVRISKAFDTFHSKPLASASLGQVHEATLRDGRRVAVKVQRPTVEQEINKDLGALHEIAEFLENHSKTARKYRFVEMVDSFSDSLHAEIDYRLEANNLRKLAKNLERFERLHVPQPITDYCSRRVLTMEFVSGTGIEDINPVVMLDLDGEELADELFEAYLSQILVDGMFHADPHPGNLLLTPEHRISLLDLGMVGFVPTGLRETILRLLLAIADGDGTAAANIAIEASDLRDDADLDTFRQKLAQQVVKRQGATMEDLQVGTLIIELTKLAAENGILVPTTVNLIAKALLNLDLIGRTLDPAFDPTAAINRHAGDIMSRRMKDSTSIQSMFRAALEAKDFMEALPSRMNNILGKIANNEIEVQVNAIDEDRLLVGLQQVANRVTMGLVLAALIIGAALLIHIDTPGFQIFGYPGLAIILFLGAALGGFSLVISIWKNDREVRHNK